MKRIDDKIKEIEKKDKRYQWAYYIIVAMLVGFLYYVSTTRKQMDLQADQIDVLTIKATETYKDLKKSDSINKKLYDDLKNSLQPEQYWNHIEKANSVEDYIEYLTNIWGIKRDSLDMNSAISNIKKSGSIGETGWLYVGNETENGPYVQPTKGQIAKIIWRRGLEKVGQIASIEDSKPKENDIIKMVKSTNRITYRRANFNSTKNKEGWRPSSKAFVSEVKKNDAEVWVKIRYY
ncbi:hypothetical protein [Hwangdonia seohaensis]|uniref:Uncharacterized protein n=1 Tax=Hwangdonia seohaensis TaxID=1240727 RepID=A0ABW3RDU0_9FLAO|nr:hypothetical protein [Hwangdonia seohaensis]